MEHDPDEIRALSPGRSWRDYSEDDIRRAAAQHGGTCLNARQALALDVLCACDDLWSRIAGRSSTNGQMPLSELVRLTNMSLLELLPEVVDMAIRSPINTPLVFDEQRGEEPAIIDGELRVVAQVQVGARAENDPHPGDMDDILAQEAGRWSPPSIDVPRVLAVGYWVDWGLLDDRCEDWEARKRLENMVERFGQAARARAGIQAG